MYPPSVTSGTASATISIRNLRFPSFIFWLWVCAVPISLPMDPLSSPVAKISAHRENWFLGRACWGVGERLHLCFFFNHKPAGVFLFKRKFCKSNIVICEPVKWASASGSLGGEYMPRGWNPSFVNAAVRLEEPARVSWVQQGERAGSCFPQEGRCKPFCCKWREAANPVVAMIFLRQGRFSITATVCCSIVVSRGTCQF